MTIEVKQIAMYGGMIVVPLILIGVLASKLTHNGNAGTGDAPSLAQAPRASSAPAVAAASAAPPAVPQSGPGGAGSAGTQTDLADKKLAADVKPVAATPKVTEGKSSDEHASATGSVKVLVRPWGEIYLDGRKLGVSPPLTKLPVAAGKHTIEIRNTTFPAYTQQIQVKAGEEIKISYKFAN